MKNYIKKNANKIKLFKDKIKTWYKCLTDERCKNIVIIYQMGKVGSSSIYFTLKDYYKLPNVMHMHHMSPKYLEQIKTWHTENRYRYMPRHLLESEAFYNKWEKTKINKKIQIITLVRDPIAVYISSIFQNMDQVYYEFIDETKKIKQQELISYIITTLGDEERASKGRFFNWYNYFMNWFDNELKEVFGIDIYTESFDMSKGYQILSHDNIKALILKVETLNQSNKEAFSRFLQINDFELKNTNIGENKKYGKCYRTLLDNIIVPSEILDKVYSHKLVKHFYSEDEVKQFKSKWGKK